MTSIRGHEPTCPIARETWCIWDGDKCDWCSAYRKGFAAGRSCDCDRCAIAEHHAELEFASLHEEGLA